MGNLLFDFENLGPRFLTIFPGPRFSKSNEKFPKAYLEISTTIYIIFKVDEIPANRDMDQNQPSGETNSSSQMELKPCDFQQGRRKRIGIGHCILRILI